MRFNEISLCRINTRCKAIPKKRWHFIARLLVLPLSGVAKGNTPSEEEWRSVFESVNAGRVSGPAKIAADIQLKPSFWRWLTSSENPITVVSWNNFYIPPQNANHFLRLIGLHKIEDNERGIQIKKRDMISLFFSISLVQLVYKSFEPYIKVDGSRVLTAVKTFHSKDMPAITLVAAVHFGTPEYFDDQHKILLKKDLVFYEHPGSAPPESRVGACAEYLRQHGRSAELATGLKEQYSYNFEMQYYPEHFRRVDLPIDFKQFVTYFPTLPIFNSTTFCKPLLKNAQNGYPSLTGAREKLAEALASSGSEYDQVYDPDPKLEKFLCRDRESHVLHELEPLIAENKLKSIGVLYGAAHMRRLEQSLKSLGYQLDQEGWIEAFSYAVLRAS